MKHIFIINPVSGVNNAQKMMEPRIRRAAKKLHLEFKILVTEYRGHASEIAREWAETGEKLRLYACGGDGTLNEVIRGVLGFPNVEVACVPCGSGNDFVRNFGSQKDFLDLEDLMQGEPHIIDLIETNQGIATSICSAGLDAQVAYGIPKFRRIPCLGGETAYKLSILTSLCSRLGHQLRITADGEVFTGEYLMLAICNGQTYGGGFKASPEADMQDGLLELVLVKKISRLRIAGVVNLYKSGQHIENGQVNPAVADLMQYRRVKEVTVEVLDNHPLIVTQDGECGPCTRLEARVMESSVQIVLPKSLCSRAAQSAEQQEKEESIL